MPKSHRITPELFPKRIQTRGGSLVARMMN
jgi:hypothetical protein